MVLNVRQLIVPAGPVVRLTHARQEQRDDLLQLVATEHAPFVPYYESPGPSTTPYAIMRTGDMVGGVLLQRSPEAAESTDDAGLAALFIRAARRDQGLGSVAIAAAVRLLAGEGFQRIIAEWVWSIPMYQRLGFQFWRTRRVEG